LGTPIHLSIFVNVEVSASSAAFEWCRTVADQSFSVIRKIHDGLRQPPDDFLKRFNFVVTGFHLTVAVMKK
jgi:hypothetical protein